jgi:cytochrome c-type biogenesis protein CcmH
MNLKMIFLLSVMFFASAYNRVGEAQLADPALESRAVELFRQLRCVGGEGESVADSNANLAKSMRLVVREQISAGKDEQQIRGFFRARYGQNIWMDELSLQSQIFLFGLPIFICVSAFVFLFLGLRRKR